MNKVVSKICILMVCNFMAGLTAHAQTVIGGTNGNPSAVLELRSNDRGLLLPRLTSAERLAIASPAEGLVIYNTTEGCVEINLGSSASPDWNCLLAITGRVGLVDCEAVAQIGTLRAGTAASGVSISVPYTGGNGRFYNAQTISSTGVTGLTATRAAGTFAEGSGSVTYNISGMPSGVGIASFILNIGGQICTVQYNVIQASCGAYIASGLWKEFMCHNLGANTSVNPFTPGWDLIGDYIQWGRNPTCFGTDDLDGASSCVSPVYGAAAPWGSETISDNAGAITGWNTMDASDGSWQDGVKTSNDPCPPGYRIPTISQWSGLINMNLSTVTYIGSWTSGTTIYDSGIMIGDSLFLPAGGLRLHANGYLNHRGGRGDYWSSTESGSRAHAVYFYNSEIRLNNLNYRTSGFSLRCVAE